MDQRTYFHQHTYRKLALQKLLQDYLLFHMCSLDWCAISTFQKGKTLQEAQYSQDLAKQSSWSKCFQDYANQLNLSETLGYQINQLKKDSSFQMDLSIRFTLAICYVIYFLYFSLILDHKPTLLNRHLQIESSTQEVSFHRQPHLSHQSIGEVAAIYHGPLLVGCLNLHSISSFCTPNLKCCLLVQTPKVLSIQTVHNH